MKEIEWKKLIVEGLVTLAIGLIADGITQGVSERKKKGNFEKTQVADLTVEELRNILKES